MNQSYDRGQQGVRRISAGIVLGMVLVAAGVAGGLSGCAGGLPSRVPSGLFQVVGVDDIHSQSVLTTHTSGADVVRLEVPTDGSQGVALSIELTCGGGGSGRYLYEDDVHHDGVLAPVPGTVEVDLTECAGSWAASNPGSLTDMLNSPMTLHRISDWEMTLAGRGFVLHLWDHPRM